ncbi:LacI family DNA-binding transcriptional regulator [Ruania halotolerans]|uniref:LacI family DNA-binding transcriptional regulator n=1 Tax=Ruania halotolerans TaxID=2897773 RepID=UPI001E44AEBC|nr:substrate-binding domain-containing protein [Ruania halotolerans]UFU05385.1 substrate-binding domain-containing protein [Ruania halotolerans]
MLPTERRARLLRELRVHGTVRTEEFALRVGASGMTVRRDLADLELAGMLQRVHGGAVSPSEPLAAPRASAPVATIGMVVPSATYYFPDIIRGAREAIAAADSRMILAVSDYSRAREREQITRLLDRGVDGLLVAPASHAPDDPQTYELLAAAPAAVVVLERSLDGSPWQGELDIVRCDHEVGGQLAAAHLLETGCTRIVVATRTGPTAPLVRAGVRRALGAVGLEPAAVTLPPAGAPAAAVHEALTALVDRCRTGDVDGVIVVPDEVAIGLVDLAEDAGLSIPADLAVIAYDDEVAALCATPLTAIAPPRHDVGESGAHLCLRRVMSRLRADSPRAWSSLALSPVLRVRGTTGNSVPAPPWASR